MELPHVHMVIIEVWVQNCNSIYHFDRFVYAELHDQKNILNSMT